MASFQPRILAGSALPIWRQIVDGIAQAVLDGQLELGETLPGVREMAERLLINHNTVVKAYAELVRDGILVAQPGRGHVVAKRRVVFSAAERARRLEAALDEVVGTAARLGIPAREVIQALAHRLGCDPDQGRK
jgi:GntR family transcriptional regulator